jgi:hypothetical protein
MNSSAAAITCCGFDANATAADRLTDQVVNDDRPEPAPSTVAGFIARATGHVADALKYWEPRRVIYNAVLAAVVLGHVLVGWPESKLALSMNVLLGLFFLGVLANVCYCAVYIVDLFVQFSGLRGAWRKWRGALLGVGTAFAAVIAHFFSLNILAGG